MDSSRRIAVTVGVAVIAVLVGCGGGSGADGGGGCLRLRGETLSDPAGVLEAAREIEASGSIFLESEATKAIPALEAAVAGSSPATIFETVEVLRMACAVEAEG